ncbi:MAG: nucleotidyltransferase family protein [Anaerolineae bacterium]
MAALHGVVGLVRHTLLARDIAASVPEPTWQAMGQAASQIVFDGMVQQRQLAAVLAALHSAGIEPLLLKGYALAELIYPDPLARAHRPIWTCWCGPTRWSQPAKPWPAWAAHCPIGLRWRCNWPTPMICR